MFKKVLIANRGEIAVRVIAALREMGIRSVAVYSEADRECLHVRLADEAVCIGPAAAAQSYLNIQALIAAAEVTQAEAVHPGYGFLAENPRFAEVCHDCGLVFIGPDAGMMEKLGDKISARKLARKAGHLARGDLVPELLHHARVGADENQAAVDFGERGFRPESRSREWSLPGSLRPRR